MTNAMIMDPAAWTAASLAARLQRVAMERAGAVALVDGHRRVTYREMLARADALAAELRRRRIGPGDLVAVALPRSVEQVIAVVGVVRAGAAYVPLDLSHPGERRAGMLADAQPRCVVVSRDGSVDGLAGHDVLELPEPCGDVAAQPVLPGPTDPAYVIYTSGSTGRPKGVVVTHHNVSRLFATTERLFAFGPEDVWTLFHSIAFDFSVWEMWGALLYGGRLVVVPASTARAADAFHELVVRSGVTVLNQTPSAFRAFDAANAAAGRVPTALRHVIFGGEALDPRTLAGWFGAHGDSTPRLVNMYGITETTVHTTFRPMRTSDAHGDGKSLIGAPLPDLRIELRGPDGAPVNHGEIGEIFVGGAGVANGYLRRPDLTAERFLPDPTTPGGRLYRSGDLARRTPDGDLEYLGRGDAQVKLRGFRIELGEIEAALRTAPSVAEAVVALRGDPASDARLVAWLVPATGAAIDPRALQQHVASRLPDYMVPAAYVRIDRVPRNVNDKVDRGALPEPGPRDLPRAMDSESPRTPTEAAVARLWSETLGVEDVRREDDFVSLGGHSLLATRVAFGCAAQLGKEITGLDVLAARTLAAFAALVDAAPAARSVAPAAAGAAPATPGQVGVLLQQRLAGSAPVLNETASVRLIGRVDDERLRAAIAATLAAHPAFASRFVERGGQWVQEPASGTAPPVVIETMAGATDEAVRARLVAFAGAPFDLEHGPLARAIVLRSGPESCTLLLAAHHAVVDEWSYHLVLEEVGRRLAGQPELTRDVGPFAHGARRAAADGAAAAGVRAHWAKELEGAALEVEMGCEADSGADQHVGSVVEIPLPPSVTHDVRRGLRALGVTEFEAGLAAFAAVLEHEAHRPDVTVLVTLADRDRPAVADVVGYMLDVLPVRVQLAGDPTLADVLATVRAAIARSAANRAITVGDSVAAAGLSLASRERGIGAAFYTRQEEVAPHLRIQGVRSEPFPVHLGVAKFDASVYLISGPDRLAVRLEHRHGALGASAARRLAERTARALAAFATAPASKLAAFDLLTPEERGLALAVARGPEGPAAPAPFVPQQVGVVARARAGLPAIAESGRAVTYGALLAAADALARRLRELGVGRGHVVPVLGKRSAALVASWLGVLRAGAAYAPVEAEQPASRRGAMIEDCRPVAVVADAAFREGIPDGVPVIDLADPYRTEAAAPLSLPSLEDQDVAYVVFTSGSTGRPKGVEVGHAALAHIVAWHQKQLAATAEDHVPLLSGIGFDATVLETWATLCTGGVVELPDEDVRIDPPRLRDWMIERGVTTAFVPTVLAEALLALPWPDRIPLRMMQTGGEALRSRPRAGLPFRFVNLYGPAEVAVWVTHHLVASEGKGLPAIGVPLDDASTWVVDHRGRLCAPRTIGELWLGGPQVGRGYRGLPERTASSFPTVEMVPGRRERAYRTGDLVRAEDDGLIHFVGRRDTQVKLRGVRIEIGEIEAVLLSHPDVAGCAVALRGTPAAPYLAAYVEARDPARPPAHGALADHVASRVPRGMVPTRWAIVERLARTTNGKVDRKVLPEISENAPSPAADVLPLRTDTERVIARIYSEVLGVPVDSRDADVFRLGGSSLAAVRIVTMISRELGAVPVRAILENPVIEALAAHVDRRRKPTPPPVAAAPSPVAPAAPLVGPGSERFVRLREGEEGVPLFCMPGIGGHAFQYRKLVERMQTRRPVLGLQLYDLEVPPATFESMKDTATAVVTEIRKERPRGPYALMGYSFGGLLALEIARQLVGAGESVELVGLLDAYAPGTTAPEPLLGKVRLHFANLFAVRGLREFFDYLGQRVRGKVRRLLFRTREIAGVGERTPAAIEQRIEEMGVRCWRAMRSYAAQSFPGRVTVFRASKLMDWARVQDPTGTCGWKPWCDDVRVVDIECKHLDLFHEPHLTTLARRLDDALISTSVPQESGRNGPIARP